MGRKRQLWFAAGIALAAVAAAGCLLLPMAAGWYDQIERGWYYSTLSYAATALTSNKKPLPPTLRDIELSGAGGFKVGEYPPFYLSTRTPGCIFAVERWRGSLTRDALYCQALHEDTIPTALEQVPALLARDNERRKQANEPLWPIEQMLPELGPK